MKDEAELSRQHISFIMKRGNGLVPLSAPGQQKKVNRQVLSQMFRVTAHVLDSQVSSVQTSRSQVCEITVQLMLGIKITRWKTFQIIGF